MKYIAYIVFVLVLVPTFFYWVYLRQPKEVPDQKNNFPFIYAAAIFLAVLVTGKIVWDADWFQKACFPANYWTRQVSIIEQEIDQERDDIKRINLMISSKKLTADIDAEHAMMDDKKLSRNMAEKNIQEELAELNNLIVIFSDQIRDDIKRIEFARSQIKHQK